MAERTRSRGGIINSTASPRIRTQKQYKYDVVNNKIVWYNRTIKDTIQGSAIWLDDSEVITDCVGERDLYNPVSHRRATETFNVSSGSAVRSTAYPAQGSEPTHGEWRNTWYTYRDEYSPLLTPWSAYNHTAPSYPLWDVVPPVNWGDLMSQVASQLEGRISTKTNLLVELAQASQTISMFRNPFNARALSQLRRSSFALSKLAKTSANSWLEYQYGWRNLYLSMRDLSQILERVRAHRQYLRETDKLYTPLCAKQNIVSTAGKGDGIGVSRAAGANSGIFLWKERAETTACVSCNIRRDGASARWSKIDQVMQATGCNDLMEALWDLVPFSFVLDWFIQTNNWVARQPAYLQQVYDLRRIGYSVKTKYIAKYRVQTLVTTLTGSSLRDEYGEAIIGYQYARYRGFPTGTGEVGFFGKLNKTQLASGLALVVQRV